jgi:peptide/nickel transport system substrate-binding protein
MMQTTPKEPEALTGQILEQRLDRRSLLRRAAAIGVAGTMMATLLAACATDDDDDDTDAPVVDPDTDDDTADEVDDADVDEEDDDDTAAPVAAGGTLNIPVNGDPTMNPFTWPNQLPAILVSKNIWSTLVKYSEDDGATPVADLASDWSATEDGLEWTFNLRDDVKWHDGEDFSADDVVFTIENILNPDVRAHFRSTILEVEEVEAPDPMTVVIRTSEPVGSLPIIMAYNINITPKHILEGQDLNEIPDYVSMPIGTGPFMVREYIHGDRLVADAFDDYFEGRPNVDTIIYRVIPDLNVVVAQLLTGELDLAQVEPLNVDTLTAAGNIDLLTRLQPSAFCLYMNNTREPFDDRMVRRALLMALDRQEIVDEILLGYGIVASSSHSPAFGPYFHEGLEPHPFDPDAAAEILEEAGWSREGGVWAKDGESLSFGLMVDAGNPTRENIALVAQQYWQDFGAEVDLEIEEWSVYIERGNANPGDYDVRTGWRITAPDPDKIPEYHSLGRNNHYGYSNPEMDALLERAKTEVDPETRVQLYHEVQEILWEDVPAGWLYYPEDILAVNQRVQGFRAIGIQDANALLYTYKVTIEE